MFELVARVIVVVGLYAACVAAGFAIISWRLI